jgi:hypothetical protein
MPPGASSDCFSRSAMLLKATMLRATSCLPTGFTHTSSCPCCTVSSPCCNARTEDIIRRIIKISTASCATTIRAITRRRL